MRTIVKHAMWGALIAGGVSLLGATAANAAETNGDEGLLSGTQILAPVTAPIDIVGNAVSVLGGGTAGSMTDAAPAVPSSPSSTETSGDAGVASGTQAMVDVVAPVTVSGNAVSVLGSSAAPPDAAAPVTESAPEAASAPAGTSGSDGILSGTQGLVSVTAPITVTGNGISVVGDSAVAEGSGGASAPAEAPVTDTTTSGDDSVLGGTQLLAPITAPITIGGNGISLLGDATAGNTTTGASAPADAPMTDPTTGGEDGILGGTQVLAPITAPITIGGNGLSVLGDATVAEDASGTSAPAGAPAADATTGGHDGILGGTQLLAPITAPISIDGNGISLLGDSTVAEGSGGASAPAEAPATDATTGGNDGILGGTQVLAPITTPITIGGNGISLIGDATVEVPGTTPGTDPGTEPGTEPGTDPGTEPGTDAGSDSNTDQATDLGIVQASVATSTRASAMSPAATGTPALAMTGGGEMAPALALLAGLMLLIGGALFRRARAAA